MQKIIIQHHSIVTEPRIVSIGTGNKALFHSKLFITKKYHTWTTIMKNNHKHSHFLSLGSPWVHKIHKDNLEIWETKLNFQH